MRKLTEESIIAFMISIPFSKKYTICDRYSVEILERDSSQGDKFYPSDDYIYVGIWDSQEKEYAALYDLDSTVDGAERIVIGYVVFDRSCAEDMKKYEEWDMSNIEEITRTHKRNNKRREVYRRVTIEDVLNSQTGQNAYFEEGREKILEWLIFATV